MIFAFQLMYGGTHRNNAKRRAQSKLASTPIQQYGSEPYHVMCLYNDCRNNKLPKDKPTILKKGDSRNMKTCHAVCPTNIQQIL